MARKIVLLEGFYVYGIKVDGTLRYVGKGSNGRIYSHRSIALSGKWGRGSDRVRYQALAEAIKRDAKITYLLYADKLTEREALLLENKLIQKICQSNPGQLWNKDRKSDAAIAERRAATATRWAKKGARKRHSRMMKKKWQDSTYKKARSVSIAAAWQRPDVRARHLAGLRRVAPSISKKVKALWRDPKYRANQVADRKSRDYSSWPRNNGSFLSHK